MCIWNSLGDLIILSMNIYETALLSATVVCKQQSIEVLWHLLTLRCGAYCAQIVRLHILRTYCAPRQLFGHNTCVLVGL